MTVGSKVYLRSFTKQDLPAMVRWNNDPEVEYYVDCNLPKTIPECEAWFAKNIPARDYRLYAVVTSEGRLIGEIELDHISWRNGQAELRIRIGEKQWWNKGYGTDAVLSALELARERLGLCRLYLRVYRFNTRAIHCYEKCGFRKRALLHREPRPGSDWKDILLMAVDVSSVSAPALAETAAASE